MATYNAQRGTTSNKPYAPATAVPTDDRSYFYDADIFKRRPFQSVAEANANTPSNVRSHFPVFIHSGALQTDGTFLGGTVTEYWFKDGVADADLVPKSSGGGGSVDPIAPLEVFMNPSGSTAAPTGTPTDTATLGVKAGKLTAIVPTYRAENAGITGAGDKTSALSTYLSSSPSVLIDAEDLTLSGTLNAGGKTLSFANGKKLNGSGTLTNVLINAPAEAQVFGNGITVTNLLNNEISVKNFGAVGDGSTDDLTAFQKALASFKNWPTSDLGYNIGATLKIPPGKYYLSSGDFLLNRGVILEGDQPANTILIFPENANGIIVDRGAYAAHIPTIRNLTIQTSGTHASPAYNKAGILIKDRCNVDNVWCYGFDGDGIAVIATAPGGGNANLSSIKHFRCYSNTRHGLYIQGADVNKMDTVDGDFVSNGECGVFDNSFLGNAHLSHHSANQGIGHPLSRAIAYNPATGCTYKSKAYHSGVEPGVASGWQNYWKQIYDEHYPAFVPAWDAAKEYQMTRCYVMYNPNSKGRFLDCYKEDDENIPYVAKGASVEGGFAAADGVDGEGICITSGNQHNELSIDTKAGFNTLSLTVRNALIQLGWVNAVGQVFGFYGKDGFINVNWANNTDYNLTRWFNPSADLSAYSRSAPNYGQGQILNYHTFFPITNAATGAFNLGYGELVFSNGAPTVGWHRFGDVALDALHKKVYFCTASGTPGTWEEGSGGTGTETDPNSVHLQTTARQMGGAWIDGPVSVGDVNPNLGFQLHVQSNTGSAMRLGTNNASKTAAALQLHDNGVIMYATPSPVQGVALFGTYSNHPLRFYTHNQDVGGFDENGNFDAENNAAILGTLRIAGGSPTTGKVWTATDNMGNGMWQASSGEANTASNVGSAGVGLFKQKTSLDLEFKKINSAPTKGVVVQANDDGNTVDIVNSGYDVYGRATVHVTDTFVPDLTWSLPAGTAGLIEAVISGKNSSGGSLTTKQSIGFNSNGSTISLDAAPTVEKAIGTPIGTWSGTPMVGFAASGNDVSLSFNIGSEVNVWFNVTYKISWTTVPS